MAKNSYDKQSWAILTREWKKACSEGKCLEAGCDLTKGTCAHLEKFLARSTFLKTEGRFTLVPNIDEFAEEMRDAQELGAWTFWKLLKSFKMPRTYTHMLFDRFYTGKTLKEIEVSRHWTSYGALRYHFNIALTQLERRFKQRGTNE